MCSIFQKLSQLLRCIEFLVLFLSQQSFLTRSSKFCFVENISKLGWIQLSNLVVYIIFREYEFTHQKFLNNINQRKIKDKLSSDATTRLGDTLTRSSEMSVNDVFPYCITENKNLSLKNINRIITCNDVFMTCKRIILKYFYVLILFQTSWIN